jgi:hypothetical protein
MLAHRPGMTTNFRDPAARSARVVDFVSPKNEGAAITVTPISWPVVKRQSNFFWQRQLPTSFIGRFQLLCSYRVRFFG